MNQRLNVSRKIALMVAVAALTLISASITIADQEATSVSASEAMRLILDGNQRFIAGKLEHPNQEPARRDLIAKGQHPFASILTCSDSRTAPEILFDRGIGDIFVVRVAGNVADKVVIESLDYSVEHLGVRFVMVLGHRRCGAVTAAVKGHDEPGDIGPMLTELRPAVKASKGMPGDPVENAVRVNVQLVVAKLMHSPELAPMVHSGKLTVIGGIYDLDSGKIDLLKD